MAYGIARLAGDASGGAATANMLLPYGYAVMPIWAGYVWSKTTNLGGIQVPFMSWDTSKVDSTGNTELVCQTRPFYNGATYDKSFSWRVPLGIYVPDESAQAIHRVQAQMDNPTAAAVLTAYCQALLFDPEDLRTTPLNALAFFLGNMRS